MWDYLLVHRQLTCGYITEESTFFPGYVMNESRVTAMQWIWGGGQRVSTFCRLSTLLLNRRTWLFITAFTATAWCTSPFSLRLGIFWFWQCQYSLRALLGYYPRASKCTKSLHKSPLISTTMPGVGTTYMLQISTLEKYEIKTKKRQ